MNNSENIKEIQKLLYEAYSKLLNVQIKDEENIEAQKEILSDINEVYKKLRDDFETSLWGEVEKRK